METGKFKHRKIWSTWCQMSASLFSSYLALRGHRNSPRHLRATKVSLERNLRDPLVHSFSFSSWWGQALNHSEPHAQLQSAIINSDSTLRETWGRKNQQVIADMENVPHKSRKWRPTPFPIVMVLPCPMTPFSLLFITARYITMTCPENLLPHDPIYSFISEHLLRAHASGTVLGTGAMS